MKNKREIPYKEGMIFAPYSVFRNNNLTPGEKNVLIYFMNFCENGISFEDNTVIAQKTRLSDSYIKKVLNSLRKKNQIEIDTKDVGGRRIFVANSLYS